MDAHAGGDAGGDADAAGADGALVAAGGDPFGAVVDEVRS